MAPTPNASENTDGQLQGAARLSWQADADTSKPPSAANPVNLVERLDGADRIETAIQISRLVV